MCRVITAGDDSNGASGSRGAQFDAGRLAVVGLPNIIGADLG